jgi:5-(carboxyamino)imidazole ribonucleotide synthase
MIGAGQLARMTWQAAVSLDVGLHVLAASPLDPAVSAGAPYTLGSTDDPDALARAATEGDVVTFDHELVPQGQLRRLVDDGHLLRPQPAALELAQDKLAARTTFQQMGIAVPAFTPVSRPQDVHDFAERHGWPLVLKARRGGYDGRGVHLVEGPAAVDSMSLDTRGGSPAWLAEEHLELAAELAVVVARRPSGQLASYPCVQTHQVDGLCRELVMPADVPAHVGRQAVAMAESLVAGIDASGICAVELFLTGDGRLLLNEIATRPHNSGHVTIEACRTSQFEQHLRAVLDWPLGSTAMVTPAAATVNLIGSGRDGEPWRGLAAALAEEQASIHLYGKQSRPERKIGHVTVLADDRLSALERARAAAAQLVAG